MPEPLPLLLDIIEALEAPEPEWPPVEVALQWWTNVDC